MNERADRTIASASELRFSSVSFAEVGVKVAVGKLTAPARLKQEVIDEGIKILPLEAEHGLGVADLPLHHRDPFDRLLISQALAEGLTIVTADPGFFDYEVPVIDAG